MAERSTQVKLLNATGLNLSRQDEGLDHGIWTDNQLPPEHIPNGGTAEWQSESNGFATGTQGHVTYSVDGGPGAFVIAWDNPFVGSNEFSVSSPAGFAGTSSDPRGNNSSVRVTLTPNF
jgi:aegerolysin